MMVFLDIFVNLFFEILTCVGIKIFYIDTFSVDTLWDHWLHIMISWRIVVSNCRPWTSSSFVKDIVFHSSSGFPVGTVEYSSYSRLWGVRGVHPVTELALYGYVSSFFVGHDMFV